MNIPLFRAKELNGNEYEQGNLNVVNEKYYITGLYGYLDDTDYGCGFTEIDQSTLAIHFPDMLDSEGNKIFASLSEDGNGGDYVTDEDGKHVTYVFRNRNVELRWIFKSKIGAMWNVDYRLLEVKGIKQ